MVLKLGLKLGAKGLGRSEYGKQLPIKENLQLDGKYRWSSIAPQLAHNYLGINFEKGEYNLCIAVLSESQVAYKDQASNMN